MTAVHGFIIWNYKCPRVPRGVRAEAPWHLATPGFLAPLVLSHSDLYFYIVLLSCFLIPSGQGLCCKHQSQGPICGSLALAVLSWEEVGGEGSARQSLFPGLRALRSIWGPLFFSCMGWHSPNPAVCLTDPSLEVQTDTWGIGNMASCKNVLPSQTTDDSDKAFVFNFAYSSLAY